ncbi:type I restriction endonuclease subunit R [Kordiimonas sp.]|uniref:type I restriction endonuclease subunit R n=1 Tax=Kordiimonas sp. TaxID=1970157 RepID=UPI003A8F48DB
MNTAEIHKEKQFEAEIVADLVAHGGYTEGDPKAYDAQLALFPRELVAFLRESQPDAWAKLTEAYGAAVEDKVIQLVAKNLNQHGTLHVLRKGVSDYNAKLDLAFFMPNTRANKESLKDYEKNRLQVTRQVNHSLSSPRDALDLVLSLNGIPVATAEIKTQFTGQTVRHAREQYKKDRDPRDPIFRFKERALVHFAFDADEVYMATRLAGVRTFFLPFNKGNAGGAGNPPNPDGYKVDYLWKEVWAKDRWLEILHRFIHLERKEKFDGGKRTVKETMIFPRYHQLDAVTKLVADARASGAGKNYLVQHSAGSGKSNSIAWLAHRLSSLHDDTDKLIFDSVIVVTDRRVLDQQLRENIHQMEHKQGVVKAITGERGSKSQELAAALSSGARIIITTLQTFPFVLEHIGTRKGTTFAVIADEAHSSQTGRASEGMKEVLASASLEEAATAEGAPEDLDDAVRLAMEAKGPQPNLSFFAFTATPKKRTKELFGTKGPDGKPHAFHLYSMRQAIEENFILDVLKNYTTYKTYFRLSKAVDDDPEIDEAKAKRAVLRYAQLHPHHIGQRVEIILEHFCTQVRHQLGGKAKAMVVTKSRLHAVRYKREFDKQIKAKNLPLGVLVAFSGTVKDPDDIGDYTEAEMNGFGEKELPEKFSGSAYQLLVVAEKYQTGFDQPLLHTMYVDRKLQGLQAVQTLARLNRTYPGKTDTFVLDFENTAEDIKEAFTPYYDRAEIDEPTDPNLLFDLKTKLENFQYFYAQDVEDFAAAFFPIKGKPSERQQSALHALCDPAIERFSSEPNEERQEEFRALLASYVRLYAFVSQMVSLADIGLEKLYVFVRLLRNKLPRREGGGMIELDDEVELTYYRTQKTFEGNASFKDGDQEGFLTGPTEVGSGKQRDEKETPLSEIIRTFNDRYQTDWTEDDKLLFEQMRNDALADTKLVEQARNNDLDQFRHVIDDRILDLLVARLERNDGIAQKLLGNAEMLAVFKHAMGKEVYDRARES